MVGDKVREEGTASTHDLAGSLQECRPLLCMKWEGTRGFEQDSDVIH